MLFATLLAQAPTDGKSLGTIQGAGTIGEEVAGSLDSNTGLVAIFSTQLSNIIGFITLLGGLFFLIYFLIGGFEWLRAGGDKGQIEKAQNRMVNGAVGLLIMILAIAIVGVVGGVFGLDLLNPGETFLELIPGN